MTDSATYPNAPVVLVAVEAKLASDGTDWADALAQPSLRTRINEYCPIYRPAEHYIHTWAPTSIPGSPPAEHVSVAKVPRFMNRGSTLAISFQPDGVVVETTAHSNYANLRAIFETALEARCIAGNVDGISRLGIRYVDEIRVPDQGAEVAWDAWVDGTLIGPSAKAAELGLTGTDWQGLARFETDSETQMVLRYGARVGYAVNPEGDLKRQTPPPGPFFLLDIDSFWEPDGIPEFDSTEVLQRLDGLHDPVRDLFEALIKSRLRDEVMSHDG